jgi:uncharacterized membrane protein YciS (DUF1049 family)
VSWLGRLFWVVLAILVFLFAVLAVNQDPVILRFVTWQSPELSVFWWLLGAFLAGLGVGVIGIAWSTVRLRLRNRRLGKALKQAEQALGRSAAET